MQYQALYHQFFIGRTVGELGNAATNIAFPLTTMCLAAMLALGIGGAAGFNLNMGAGNKKKAMYFIGNALTLMFGVGVVIALSFSVHLTQFCLTQKSMWVWLLLASHL